MGDPKAPPTQGDRSDLDGAAPQASGRQRLATLASWLILLLILLGTFTLRWKLVDAPLERDEGEYAYAGQLLLRGHPPYQHARNMKMPGIYVSYAAVMVVFGESHQGIHRGLLVINAATIVLVFLLGRRLFDAVTGLVAAASFSILSMMQSVLGFTANAEHFVLLPALAGVLTLLWAIESNRWLGLVLSGLCFGVAFLMKQHGMFFGLFGGVYLLWSELTYRPIEWGRLLGRCLLFSAAALTPFALICLWLWQVGVFDQFWFWVFDYAAAYVSQVPPHVGLTWLPKDWLEVMQPCFVLWGLAFIGIDAAWRWDPQARSRRRFLFLFGLFSFLAICPGFYFREHYFILLLPAAALFAAVGVASLSRLPQASTGTWGAAVRVLLIMGFAIGSTLWTERDYFFRRSADAIVRYNYAGNPFVEALELADYLKAHTQPDETIAVIGSEPQIYFYADRRSATGHIYTYALVEEQPFARQMQEEMMAEIEAARPAYIVYVNVPTSWMRDENSERLIFDWWERHQSHYELVGVLEMGSLAPGHFYWEEDARSRSLPDGEWWLSIWRRR
jgi:hypothetical protein